MDLVLWRHAEAEQGARDDARELTAKGKRQAKRMAAWLRKRLPPGAKVLASPARRTRQTAACLTRKYKIEKALDTGATAQSVLGAAGWPRRRGAVVVVGHQPTLGQAAALALTGAEADWSIKKGAAVWLAQRNARAGVVLRAVISPDLV